MRVSLVVILLFVSTLAHAEEPSLDVFLEQRVAEELAADGVLLSRLGVTLDVEVVGEKILISLVDESTGRVSASTKVDDVPADRDAAVATVTQIAANMTRQLDAPHEPPSEAPVDDARAREAADYEYRQEAINFGNEYEIIATTSFLSVGRRWVAYKGETKIPLRGTSFYDEIGRPDLARAYRRRRGIMWKALAVSGVSMVGAIVLVGMASAADARDCPYDDQGCRDDKKADEKLYGTAGLITLGVSMIAAGVTGWYAGRPHPISEGEAKRLAADHNKKLREELRLSPYVSADGGGLSLSGEF